MNIFGSVSINFPKKNKIKQLFDSDVEDRQAKLILEKIFHTIKSIQ